MVGIGFGIREYGAWLVSHSDVLSAGMVAIDLGCGTGADVEYMHALGMQVVGMDLALPRVAQAAARVPDALFVAGDLSLGLPFKTGVADIATASLSLHYFDTDTTAAVLRDIARILKSDGVLLCRVNVAGETVAGWRTGVERQPDFFEVEPGRFKRFFTAESLAAALSAQFEVESIERRRTQMKGGFEKRTLVARARRRS